MEVLRAKIESYHTHAHDDPMFYLMPDIGMNVIHDTDEENYYGRKLAPKLSMIMAAMRFSKASLGVTTTQFRRIIFL